MIDRKFVSKKRYLLAFTIGTAIFLFGFALTYFFAFLEYQRNITDQDYLSYKIFQDRMRYSLLNESICNNSAYSEISNDLNFQLQIMRQLENKFGKNNSDVLFRKKFYVLNQLTHYEFMKSLNFDCNKSINIILFFYSNKKENLDKSEKLGELIGILNEKNKDRLMVYSLDMELDSDLIEILKQKFSVKDTPVVILNENVRFEKIDDINEIEIFLK